MRPAEDQTILVAEDQEDDALLLRLAFRKAASKSMLKFVPDGLAALAYLQGEGEYADRNEYPFPGFLLLDLKMPRMGGLEVLELIRQDAHLKKLVVVIFTSSDQERDIDRALELGANSYLIKPSHLDDLTSLVRRLEDYWLSLNRTRPIGGEAVAGESVGVASVQRI
jgi:CheY-like chemotaxis protein